MDLWTVVVSVLSSGIVSAAIFFGLKKYLGAYLEEKAKNLATKEDLQIFVNQVRESEKAKIEAQSQSIDQLVANTHALTSTTETIRAKVTDETWDRQQRWITKHAMYRELLESMARMYHYQTKRHHAFQNPGIEEAEKIALFEEMKVHLDDLDTRMHVSTLSVNSAVYGILSEFNLKHLTDAMEEALRIHNTIGRFSQAARSDLGYGSFTTPTKPF
jgi:hypothetical protein